MKTKRIYLYIPLLVCLMACTQELDLNNLRPEPRLVLNSVAIVGEPVTASVSKTWFFTDENPNISLPEAEVSLYVNNHFQEKMAWVKGYSEYNSKGYFQSIYKPAAGDRIGIKVSVDSYRELGAEVQMPEPCDIIDASTQLEEMYSENVYYAKRRVKVTFRDPPGLSDYYLFLIEEGTPVWDPYLEEYTGEYTWKKANVTYEDEPLFTAHITPLERILGFDWLSTGFGRVFSDELIDGKEYTLNVSLHGAYYVYPPYWSGWEEPAINKEYTMKYRINLYTLAEPYYRYMKSIIGMTDQSLYQQLVKAGLAEPVSIYTNIQNGIGIVGACNPSSVEIILDDLE